MDRPGLMAPPKLNAEPLRPGLMAPAAAPAHELDLRAVLWSLAVVLGIVGLCLEVALP
jgi:hypothetical protein